MTKFTASGHQLVTRQRNGKNGRSVSKVDVVYQRSTSATSVPTTWVTTAPKLPKGYYLWSATKVTYKEADGKTTTEVIGAQCIASADNLKTTVERYAQTTSRTTPPDNSSNNWKEGDTSGVQAKDGYYTWTQTKIIWQDGTITYTTPICITGDKGTQGKDGNDGAAGNGSRIRYALSKHPTSTNNTTPPADLTNPKYWTSNGYIGVYSKYSIFDENKTYNGTKYDDGWLMWQLAMPTPTTDKPYLWALSYVLKESTSEYLVPATDNNTFTYVRVNGTDGKAGKDGKNGTDGNGIASRTAYFVVTDKAKLSSHSDIDASQWSATFPTLADMSNQKPYIWKSVLTKYTKQAGDYWSTPELVTTYHSGSNANLIDNASFVSTDRMSAWQMKNGTIMTGGNYGRNFFRGLNSQRYSEAIYKEVLLQALWAKTGVQKLKPATWYTLSYWSRQGAQDVTVNATKSDYGFATQNLYLFKNHPYTLVVNGKVNKNSKTGDRFLRVYVYNSGWTKAWNVDIKATTDTDSQIDFTPDTDGEYFISAFLYPNDTDRSTVDYGTVTVNRWRIVDAAQIAVSYIYPSAVDTTQGYFIDGVQYTDNNTDLHNTLIPNGSWNWQRHVITFKTKAKYSNDYDFNDNDTERVLFRLYSSPMTGQNDYLDICMPKLEEGMFATGFTDSAEDAKGINGCILRTTEWATGVNYHNDEQLTSGTRYLDIAVITRSATTFDAFKCRKSHLSSASNAPQTGVITEYWEPFDDMAPIYTPLIMAQYALLRFAQTNQLLVMKADGTTVNAAMGGGTYPLWVGATEGANAPFRVDENGKLYATGAEISGTVNATDGTFKGKLNGVSGTFYKLSALDANGKEACTIYFSSDGHMTLEGDMYNQGYNTAQGRPYRFYTSDIMCRGLFGHRERYIAYVRGTYMTVYPKGTDKAGENVTLETQKLTDGTTCYKIPLYSPGTDNSSGMPIDVVVFNTTADYYYLLTSWGNGKAVDLVNGNDSQDVHFCDQGGWHSFQGGASVHCVLIDNKKFTSPVLADTYPGLGVFWTGENDLDWTKR